MLTETSNTPSTNIQICNMYQTNNWQNSRTVGKCSIMTSSQNNNSVVITVIRLNIATVSEFVCPLYVAILNTPRSANWL
jgi:uncharacterized protein YhfF